MTDESEEQKEEETESEPEGSDSGDKYETTPVIERARQERERMEAATKAQKEENDRTEAIMAKRALGGQTEAGSADEKPKEETPKEYSDRIMRGEHEEK